MPASSNGDRVPRDGFKEAGSTMITIATKPGTPHHDELVLVQVNTAEGNKQSKETTWARPLGNDLYEIEGPLHLVTGVNPKDVVRAIVLPGEAVPSVSEIVKRNGYRTLHIAFSEAAPTGEQQGLLGTLENWGATHEMAFERFYTVVVTPEGDFQAVCAFLKSFRAKGLIMYEPEINIDALYRYRFSVP